MAKKKPFRRKKAKNQREKVYQYLAQYKQKFGIGSYKYRVVFVRGEKAKDYYAEALMNGKKVKLFFNEDLMESDPCEIHDTVVHELLHVVFYKMMEKTTNIVTQYVRRADMRKRLENKICDLEHGIIDKLTPAFTANHKKYCSKEKHGEE